MAQVNKGSRKLYGTRVPDDIATRLEADAAAAHLSYSEFIADVLAKSYGVTPPSERFVSKKDQQKRQQQGVLAIEAA